MKSMQKSFAYPLTTGPIFVILLYIGWKNERTTAQSTVVSSPSGVDEARYRLVVS